MALFCFEIAVNFIIGDFLMMLRCRYRRYNFRMLVTINEDIKDMVVTNWIF